MRQGGAAGKAAVIVWRRWIFPLLLVLVFGACAAALVKIAFFPDSSEAMVSPEASIGDPVIPVERGSVVNALTLSGNVARDEAFPVRAEVTLSLIHI